MCMCTNDPAHMLDDYQIIDTYDLLQKKMNYTTLLMITLFHFQSRDKKGFPTPFGVGGGEGGEAHLKHPIGNRLKK